MSNKYKWLKMPNKSGWWIASGNVFGPNSIGKYYEHFSSVPVYVNKKYKNDSGWSHGGLFDFRTMACRPNEIHSWMYLYPIECFDFIRGSWGEASHSNHYKYEERRWEMSWQSWDLVKSFYYTFDYTEGGRHKSDRLSIAYINKDRNVVRMNKDFTGFERLESLKNTEWSLIQPWKLFEESVVQQIVGNRFFGRLFNIFRR